MTTCFMRLSTCKLFHQEANNYKARIAGNATTDGMDEEREWIIISGKHDCKPCTDFRTFRLTQTLASTAMKARKATASGGWVLFDFY